MIVGVGAAYALRGTAPSPPPDAVAASRIASPLPSPSLVATFGSPVSLTPAQERSDDRLIAKAFSSSPPVAGDLDAVETGRSAWVRSTGCDHVGAVVRTSATGAPIDADVPLIVGHGGGRSFRIVVILERSDVATMSIWAVPHGRSAAPHATPLLQAQNSTPSPLVVGASFTTDQPADLHRLRVETRSGTPFRAEIETCQGD